MHITKPLTQPRALQTLVLGDIGLLLLLSCLRFLPLLLLNGQTGWHRDELDFLDNARYLDWGYVGYPPVTPFLARIALTLFGPSLTGVRLFPTLAAALVMLLAGLMARELGGRRWAQAAAAVAAAIAPFALLGGTLLIYSSFDYVWWSLIAYQMIRLLKSDNPRWWLGIGATIGVGMLTKYTMAFLVAGIVAGVALTRNRRHLLSPWLWGGVALSLLIVAPNLLWQMQHNLISLDFLRSIHARDVLEGRAEGYLTQQFFFTTNVVTIPLWITGLYFYFVSQTGKNYRPLGWMFLIPFVLFLITQGRPYYLMPAYPMLLAGGSVLVEQWLASLSPARAGILKGIGWAACAVSGLAFAFIALPIAPINSPLWNTASNINGELREMVGWPELVETVAGIYAGLPEEDKPQTVILTGDYGEAGAINLYGPAYGLPRAISGMNSYWLRGYGDPPPQTVIVLGMSVWQAQSLFQSCRTAGRITNRFDVRNEESRDHPSISVCRVPREPWPDLWKRMQSFG